MCKEQRLKQNRLDLFSFERERNRFVYKGKVCHERKRLFDAVILAEGNKKEILHTEQRADVFGVGGQTVVCRNRDYYRAVVAQVRFTCHQYRRIGDRICQL